ncbi:MAG: PilZ domain-containing protein [Bryobacteraceae bacterium]
MSEQRKSKRFELKLPVELVKTGSKPIIGMGETRNLSSGGVLFVSETQVEVGSPIEYIISLPSSSGRLGEIRLRCMGKVLRREEAMRAVAVTLERYEFVRAR